MRINQKMVFFLFAVFSVQLVMFSTFSSKAFAKTVVENDMDFTANESSLLQGNLHISVASPHSSVIAKDYPLFSLLDFGKIMDLQSTKFFLGKYLYVVPRPISDFRKEILHTEKGFLLLSKKTKIVSSQRLSHEKMLLKIQKAAHIYTMESKADFNFISSDQFAELDYFSGLQEATHPYLPSHMTVQYSYDYNKIINKSLHLCTYSSLQKQKTLIHCYAILGMDLGWYNKTRWLIDAKKKFMDDLLHVVNNMLSFNPKT